MKTLLENTKVKMIILCLALAASFALGYSIGSPSPELKHSIKLDQIEQSMLKETRGIGLRLINCKQAVEKGESPDPDLCYQLRLYGGAMIARIYDGYGEPDYDRLSLKYLFGLAHYLNRGALENLTAAEWQQLFVDAEAAIEIYRTDLEDPNLLLDELDKLLEGKPFPAAFLAAYDIPYVDND